MDHVGSNFLTCALWRSAGPKGDHVGKTSNRAEPELAFLLSSLLAISGVSSARSLDLKLWSCQSTLFYPTPGEQCSWPSL